MGQDEWAHREPVQTVKDRIYMEMVMSVAKLSTCYRRGVGALAIDVDGLVCGVGYNGVPRGWKHCAYGGDIEGDTLVGKWPFVCGKGTTEDCLAEHAEQNLIANSHDSARILSIYLSFSPCKTCALMLVNLPNLRSLIYGDSHDDNAAIMILLQAKDRSGLLTRKYNPDLAQLPYPHLKGDK